jgi:hypothetical protein
MHSSLTHRLAIVRQSDLLRDAAAARLAASQRVTDNSARDPGGAPHAMVATKSVRRRNVPALRRVLGR